MLDFMSVIVGIMQISLSIGVAILILASMVYIGFIVFGENGLASYRPGDQAIESQEIYYLNIQYI